MIKVRFVIIDCVAKQYLWILVSFLFLQLPLPFKCPGGGNSVHTLLENPDKPDCFFELWTDVECTLLCWHYWKDAVLKVMLWGLLRSLNISQIFKILENHSLVIWNLFSCQQNMHVKVYQLGYFVNLGQVIWPIAFKLNSIG